MKKLYRAQQNFIEIEQFHLKRDFHFLISIGLIYYNFSFFFNKK